jgi:hypothetical protein
MMQLTQAMDKLSLTVMTAVLLAAFPVSVVMFAAQSM